MLLHHALAPCSLAARERTCDRPRLVRCVPRTRGVARWDLRSRSHHALAPYALARALQYALVIYSMQNEMLCAFGFPPHAVELSRSSVTEALAQRGPRTNRCGAVAPLRRLSTSRYCAKRFQSPVHTSFHAWAIAHHVLSASSQVMPTRNQACPMPTGKTRAVAPHPAFLWW